MDFIQNNDKFMQHVIEFARKVHVKPKFSNQLHIKVILHKGICVTPVSQCGKQSC